MFLRNRVGLTPTFDHQQLMMQLFSVETVAKGALFYAQNPIKEETVARVDVGLFYLEDRSAVTRKRLKGNGVKDAIAWVIVRV